MNINEITNNINTTYNTTAKTDKIKMVTPIEFVVETEGENDDGDK